MLEAALRDAARFDGGQMRTFQRHYEVQRRSHDVTEDLGDDAFEISVIMPGEIVGANTDTVTRSRATWRFGGERFRDHSMELLVSSRLELVPPDSTR